MEEIIVGNAGDDGDGDLFNNAAQTWNHTFFWNSLSPQGGGKPEGSIVQLIEESFGSLKAFKETFVETAAGEFGSGWAWLLVEDGKLVVETTSDAMTPLAEGRQALVCCDTWEHAYYLDYQNDKNAFFEAFAGNLINWSFAEENLQNQGEGNRIAAQRYRQGQEAFAKEGDVEKKAREAADALDGQEGEELEKARKEAGT